jgi:LysM repeat protein
MKRIAAGMSWLAILAGLGILGGTVPTAVAQHRSARRSHVRRATPAPKPVIIRVETGETLDSIAQRYQVSAEELALFNNLMRDTRIRAGQKLLIPPKAAANADSGADREVVGQRIHFADGGTFEVDEVWKQGPDLWYRRGQIAGQLDREVRSVEPVYGSAPATAKNVAQPTAAVANAPAPGPSALKVVEEKAAPADAAAETIWIYLKGGAKVRAEEVTEAPEGTWYRHGTLSVLLDRERIDRIERGEPNTMHTDSSDSSWTSGSARLDGLIRTNGTRFGVDPYLVFLVIEQESQFHPRAVSPKGARGLMQLMPGTSRRLGVRNPFDPAENVRGGTQYLKELVDMFNGRVDLVLASYNAGEGAVMRYGRSVPPYQETREYVKKISKRYAQEKKPRGKNKN